MWPKPPSRARDRPPAGGSGRESPLPSRPANRGARACFAGDRRVWWTAAAVGLPLVAFMVVWCLIPRPYYTGTDSVNAFTLTPPVHPGQRVCQSGLNLPAGTARIEVDTGNGTPRIPALAMTLKAAGRTVVSRIPASRASAVPIGRVSFAIPKRPPTPASVPATVCLSSGTVIAFGISTTTEGIQPPMRIGGVPQLARLAVWYAPPAGAQRSYLAEATQILDRATLFAPGFLSPALLAIVLLVLLPGIALLSVRSLAVAVAGGGRRLALCVFLIAFVNGAAWAVITPAFQAPDEVDHFAYVQSLAERGQQPTGYPATPRLRWSTEENNSLNPSGFTNNHQGGDSRNAWLPADVAAYRRLVASNSNSPADGGGFTGASGYGPFYYLALVPAYFLAPSHGIFTQLGLARLASALIGALSALFAFLIVRELAPRRRWLAVLAGLFVAYQPMYTFLSGSVNNDIGIDAGGAAVTYLLVRMLQRGLSPRLMLALGVLLGLLPFVKGSGYDFVPIAAIATLAALWRHRPSGSLSRARASRREVIGSLGVLVVTGLLAWVAGDHLTNALRPGPPSAGASEAIATTGGTLDPILHHLSSYLTYVWQVFLPRLPGMNSHFPSGYPASTIFIDRGWGAFGFFQIYFPSWIYWVIGSATILAILLGVPALYRERAVVRQRWMHLVLLLLVPVVVSMGFLAVFYTPSQRAVITEFGRYEFPALAALAAIGVGTLHGLGRRWLLYGGAAVASAMIVFCYTSQLLTLTRFYG